MWVGVRLQPLLCKLWSMRASVAAPGRSGKLPALGLSLQHTSSFATALDCSSVWRGCSVCEREGGGLVSWFGCLSLLAALSHEIQTFVPLLVYVCQTGACSPCMVAAAERCLLQPQTPKP